MQTRGDVTPHTIGGYSYFKLRNIGGAIGFGWGGASNTITIDTSAGYAE